MGILSTAFGLIRGTSPKTIDDIFDAEKGLLTKAGAWIGNANFTQEEQAELSAKTQESVRDFVVATLSESTERSQTRRTIATEFFRFYMALICIAVVVYPVDPTWSAMIVGLITSLAVGSVVTAITIFFFGSHAHAKFVETRPNQD